MGILMALRGEARPFPSCRRSPMLRAMRPALVALALLPAADRGGAGAARIGVLSSPDDESAETATALVDAWTSAAGPEAEFVQRTVGRGEKEVAAALEDMHRENVRMIVAVGDAATTRVRDAVRDV